jgi:hypothetical protein
MKQDILIGLLSNKETFTKIIKDFPGMYSPCVTIKQNVSSEMVAKACEKVIIFYNSNEKFKHFIDSLMVSYNDSHEINTYNVAGMIFVIDHKEETYKKLMDTAKKEKWQYKGIAIVQDFNNLRLYFY